MISRALIDTEFTDLIEIKLISIVIVTDSQEEFYAEVPFESSKCNKFVPETVMPLLGQIAGASCSSLDKLRSRLEQ